MLRAPLRQGAAGGAHMSTQYEGGAAFGWFLDTRHLVQFLAELPEKNHEEKRWNPETGEPADPVVIVDQERGQYLNLIPGGDQPIKVDFLSILAWVIQTYCGVMKSLSTSRKQLTPSLMMLLSFHAQTKIGKYLGLLLAWLSMTKTLNTCRPVSTF